MSLLKKLLDKAATTLTQRGSDNGYDKAAGTAQEERSAAQAACIYNAITGQSMSENDAWTFMMALKLVRMENQIKTGRGDLLDSCTDLISYAALKSESAMQDYRPAQVKALTAALITQGYVRRTDPRAKPVTGNHPSLTEPSDVPHTTAVRPDR